MTAPTRTSNKQILDAINSLTAAITATLVAPKEAPELPVLTQPAQVAIATPAIEIVEQQAKPVVEAGPVKLDKSYVSHMANGKCQDFANKHGQQVVLYARHNNRGENKLAYCLATKFANLKDRGLIGAVQVINPTS